MRRLHVDRPRTDAGVGRPGLGPSLPLMVKNQDTEKLHKTVNEGKRESSSGVGGRRPAES